MAPRSPSPTGSHRSRRDDERTKDRRPRRSASPDKRYRDRDSRRDYERRPPRREDDAHRQSRRDRSRDRHRSPDRLAARDRRDRSKERQRKPRDPSRDRHRDKRSDKDARHSKTSDQRPSAPQPSSKSAEEVKKAERLAKLQAWKKKQAEEQEKKDQDLRAAGGPRNVLEEMDKKANDALKSASPPSPSTPTQDTFPTAYQGKFDPKAIVKKATASAGLHTTLGDDLAIPSNMPPPAAPSQSASSAKKQNGVTSKEALKPLKAKGNLSGFGLAGKQPDSDKVPSKRTLDFGDDGPTRKKFERLPTPPPGQEQVNGNTSTINGSTAEQDQDEDEGEEDDDGEDIAMADAGNEEEALAAARKAAEDREERHIAQSADNALETKDAEDDTRMTEAVEPNDEEEEEIDPLDAFMNGLDSEGNMEKAPGLATAASRNAKQIEPEALFNDEGDGDMTAVNADPDDILNMAKQTKKKRDMPKTNHETANYEPFRKDFYTEPSALVNMTEEEEAELRMEYDGIKVRGVNAPKPVQTWPQCGLNTQALNVIRKLGYEKPTPIQAQAIPCIMAGRDTLGVAKTGSGKTLAFLLPMFRHIKDQRPLSDLDGPIGLIIAPTRELTNQIYTETKPFLKALNLRAVCCYGGAPIKDQIAELKRGCHIMVCTAGRLIDLLAANSGRVTNLRRLTYLVLDEADRMFDMGFEPQISKIVSNARPDRQTVLFSATFPPKMEALARKALTKPIEIMIGARSVVAPDIKQIVEVRAEDTKFTRLLQLLGEIHEDEDARSLVFVEKQEKAEDVMSALLKRGYPTFTIHGGKDQEDRDSVLQDYRAGIFPCLVATSVAARGLDVKQLKLVVNYDCPNHLEDYVHRCGRTGRAGQKGLAVTFVTEDQGRHAGDIAKALKQSDQAIPEDLQKLVDDFAAKVKDGQEKGSHGGFGGRGIEELNRRQEAARNQQRKAYKTGDEPEEEEEKVKEEKVEEIVVKAAGTTSTQLVGVPEGIDLNGPIKVHKTEIAPVNPQDRMKGVSAAVEAINARLRKAGDIRGNAPIDNKGPDAGAFHATLEINDFPQKARWAVTNRTNVAKVLESTGTSITSKGNFYPLDKPPGPEDPPKLYLLVEGDTEVVVTNAMRELMRLLRDGVSAALDSDARAPVSGRYKVDVA